MTEPGDGPDQDPHNVRPALQRILHVLEDCMDGRVSVAAIFRTLAEPPYGVSDGIAPILLAVFVVIHARHVALYENGSFLQSLTANDFRRLLKSPALFEIQYSKVTEVRAELFERLARILGLATTSDGRTELLDVVRPLLVFVARLPDYTHRTKLLSDRTAAVRSALLQAREPAPLVFRDLPRACGLAPFAPDETDETAVQHFVVALKGALDDLAAAYPNLTGRMKETFVRAFDASGTFEHARSAVAERAGAVAMRASETRLKAFCLRLVDDNLPEAEWLESLGSFICSKVPTKWTDIDAVQFEQELATLCGRFRRVESVAFHEGVRAQAGTAVRVAVTRADGMEVDRVLYISADEEDEVARIETRLRDLLGHHKHIGLAAMSRAFWDLSPQEGEDE